MFAGEKILIKHHLNERGVNYLLNVGPDALGRIPAPAMDILRAVGKNAKQSCLRCADPFC